MGVPKFYRWLSERYPLINQAISSELKPEFDNLYLDMNGIVHQCTHGDTQKDLKNRLTETQMFENIFKYLDKIVHIVCPQKLLYMAIDGVAPRAKMNQQRQRRFRSARDMQEALFKARANGEDIPDTTPFDSNCITPGTEFMIRLSTNLKYFVRKKMKEDSVWQQMKVIFSGAEVPGEGEHKIMKYIRQMKMQNNYNANVRHCLYGLDADLIMLALVSHEPHFALLREEVVFGAPRDRNGGNKRGTLAKFDEFQFLHISVLRAYLIEEYNCLEKLIKFEYNAEHIIDDWIFLCMLVGNDFIPHLPTLDIHEGGLDMLFEMYKKLLPELDGYLTNNGRIVYKRAEKVFELLANEESDIFAKREIELKKGNKNHYGRRKNKPHQVELDDNEWHMLGSDEIKEELDEKLENDSTDGLSSIDRTRLKYYMKKYPNYFVNPNTKELQSTEHRQTSIRNLAQEYLRGLAWVMDYYYKGCQSWTWYYPYFYAPLASDMINLNDMSINFELGQPFRPLVQLLGVLPPLSKVLLPEPYRELMTQQTSIIKSFYPLSFEVDMNGKRNSWEGIALIPFIDEELLLSAISSIDINRLSGSEKLRNKRFGQEYLFEYDPNDKTDAVPATPDLPVCRACNCKQTTWHLPEIPNNQQYIPFLMKDCIIPQPGFPHLNALKFSGLLTMARINVFTSPSKKESIICNINPSNVSIDEQLEQIVSKIGSIIWADWPYIRMGQLVRVTTQSFVFTQSSIEQKNKNHDANQFNRDYRALKSRVYTKMGVSFSENDLEAFCTIKFFTGMKRISNGAIVKEFSNESVDLPFPLVLTQYNVEDYRFVDRPPVTLEQAFPPNSTFVYIGREYYGALGVVESINNDGAIVNLDIPHPEPSFNKLMDALSQTYHPIHHMARQLQMSSSTISKLTSNVYFNPGRVDIGLGLKSNRGPLQAGGYVKRVFRYGNPYTAIQNYERTFESHANLLHMDDNNEQELKTNNDDGEWQFSDATIILLQKFKQQFPEIIDLLNNDPKGYMYNIEDLSNYETYATDILENSHKNDFAAIAEIKRNRTMNGQPLTDDEEALIEKDQNAFLEQISPDILDEARYAVRVSVQKQLPQIVLRNILDRIRVFMNEMDVLDLVLIPCTSETSSPQAKKLLETELTRYNDAIKDVKKFQVKLSQVGLHNMYRQNPTIHWSPTQEQSFDIGDRIMNLREDQGVPFGLRGNIVTTHGQYAEIIFDESILGATKLSGISEKRGKIMHRKTFLNLSKAVELQPNDGSLKKEPIVVKQTNGELFKYKFVIPKKKVTSQYKNKSNRGKYKPNYSRSDNYKQNKSKPYFGKHSKSDGYENRQQQHHQHKKQYNKNKQQQQQMQQQNQQGSGSGRHNRKKKQSKQKNQHKHQEQKQEVVSPSPEIVHQVVSPEIVYWQSLQQMHSQAPPIVSSGPPPSTQMGELQGLMSNMLNPQQQQQQQALQQHMLRNIPQHYVDPRIAVSTYTPANNNNQGNKKKNRKKKNKKN